MSMLLAAEGFGLCRISAKAVSMCRDNASIRSDEAFFRGTAVRARRARPAC